MNKDKALPLVKVYTEPSGLYSDAGWNMGMEAQRDADLIILERDFVPRERVKALVDSASQALTYFCRNVTPKHPIAQYLRQALIQLEEKP